MKRLTAPALLLAGWFVQPALAQDTLYIRLGGQAGVVRIVEEAVTLFIADDRVKADFDNINPIRLKARLTEEICKLADGPCVYHGRSIAVAHAGLDVNRAKFNAVAEDLQAAMDRVGTPYRVQNQLLALLAPMQRDIVTR